MASTDASTYKAETKRKREYSQEELEDREERKQVKIYT
jgi:hypothetical protein